MPEYAKFMKEILSKRRRLSEVDEIVAMTEEASAIIQKRAPLKVKDPGKFMLHVEFVDRELSNGLIDLGASLSLIPLSMLERLGIGELKSTRMQLQLADGSIVTPRGVCEDVLIKVGKFTFPADFVVLDMKEDLSRSLIFGRPFLATAKIKIDMDKRVVSVKAYGERIKINMPEWTEKQKEQGDAFLADMMMVWSDESLEDFFRKEGTTKKKEQPPSIKKPSSWLFRPCGRI